MKFTLDHISTLCKYTGISFVAGAVTHGAFSEGRSMLTALIGVSVYLLGIGLSRLGPNPDQHSLAAALSLGMLASIGFGFFTGGLQHFPDSPDRSLWVVPAGFIMSLIATYGLAKSGTFARSSALRYAIIGFALVLAASWAASAYFAQHGQAHGHDHGGHASEGHMATEPQAAPIQAPAVAAEPQASSSATAPAAPAPAPSGHTHAPGTKAHTD